MRLFSVKISRENYPQTLTIAYFMVGLSQVFELVYNYLFFNSLSVHQIGLFSWALALVLLFNVVVNMGIEPVLVRKFGQSELRLMPAFHAILLLRVPVIILGFGLVTILYRYEILRSTQYFVIVLIGGQVICNVLDGVFKSWLQAYHRQSIVNLVVVLFSGLKLGYIGAMYSVSWNSLYYLLIGILILRMIGSTIYSVLAYIYSIGNEAPSFMKSDTFKIAKDLLRSGFSNGGINLLGFFQNRLDWLMVSGMISTLALASYSLANKVYEIIQLVIGVSLQTIYPWLCHDNENKQSSLLLLVRLVILAGALLGLSGMFIFPALIKLFFGEKFLNVELPVMILMLASSLIASSGVFYYFALSKGLESKLLLVIGITTTLQLLSNLYLIPKLGIIGAALGMFVLAVSTLMGFTILIQVENVIPRDVVRRILIFLSISVSVVALMLLFNFPAWFAVSLIIIAVVVIGYCFLFGIEERRSMINLVTGLSQNLVLKGR